MSGQSLRFVITGARGLGRGLARCLLQRGHSIFLLDVAGDELQHTLTQHLPSVAPASNFPAGDKAFGGAKCDITQLEQVRSALAKAAEHFGGSYDCLVNMAARTDVFQTASSQEGEPGILTDKGVESWNASVATNLTGSFNVARESVKYLRSKAGTQGAGKDEKDASEWGSIINISSTRALQSEPNSEGYAATKAGLLGLTHSLASSLSSSLIRVNAILPGWIPAAHESIEGDSTGAKWNTGVSQEDHMQHWTRRVGKVEDLAQAVEFMATCGFVNGQHISLDGGMSKKMIYVE